MAEKDWSEAKAWMRAMRERIGMTQHDVAVLANLTVDMVKKYESEKYRIQPSERMREMLEHYLAEHRRAVAAIVERHRGGGAGHALVLARLQPAPRQKLFDHLFGKGRTVMDSGG